MGTMPMVADGEKPEGAGMIRGVLLALAFVAELGMLVGLGWVGWSVGSSTALSVGLALTLPSCAAAVWAVWCAPRARRRLRTPGRWALKVTLFTATFLLLLQYGPQPGAGVFGLATWVAFLLSLPTDRGVRSPDFRRSAPTSNSLG